MKPRENPYTGQLLFDFAPLPDPDWRFTLRPASTLFLPGEPVRLHFTITWKGGHGYIHPSVEFHFLVAPGGSPLEIWRRSRGCPACGAGAERRLWWHADPGNDGFVDLDQEYELAPGDYVVAARRLVGQRLRTLWLRSNEAAFRVLG